MEGIEHPSALESDYFVPTSSITVLISKITAMSKHPSIESDLVQILDEFLAKLSECDKYLKNGIFNMNFAEAALLIQSSADLYSKKVDLLWDVIFDYQKRFLLSEEQNGDKEQEIEKLEERKRKYKRKRKTNADNAETTKLVNSFSFGPAENCDYLNENYETFDLSEEWKKYNSNSGNTPECVLSKNSLFLPNTSVYSEENDYIGRYDQFHSASLVDEIFHLEKNKLLTDDSNCVTEMRIDSYLVNDFLFERNIPSTTPQETYSTELHEYINNSIHSHQLPEKDVHVCPSLQQLLCKRSFVCLERLPFNVVREKLRRHSLADSLFDEDHLSFVSDHCPSVVNLELTHCGISESFEQVTTNLENRSKSCSQDSAFYEDMEDTGNNEGNDTTQEMEETNQENMIMTENNVDFHVSTEVDVMKIARTNEIDSVRTDKEKDTESTLGKITLCAVEERTRKLQLNEPNQVLITRMKTRRKWDCLLENDTEEEVIVKKPKTRRRISRKALEKLATGISVSQKDFEKFCRLQYKPAVGEGNISPYISETENSDEENNQSSSEDEEEHEDAASAVDNNEEMLDLREEEEEESTSNLNGTNNSSRLEDLVGQHSDDPQPSRLHSTISPIPDLNQASTSADLDFLGRTSTPHRSETSGKTPQFPENDHDDDVSRRTVREWRSYIIPKLRTLEKRADFDIHEYGSRIIDPSNVGESRYFKTIVEGKDAAAVARYFVATLQLANTYNVEITGAVSGELANDSFAIKTLDKTRHHELLEEYQAPSEETFRERLERVKALNPKIPLHSTPTAGPPVKRRMIAHTSRKKMF